MLHIALYQPEIPPNTGNIIRLCANMGARLHLIHPLGFTLNEKQVRRAGLDYQALTAITEYADYPTFLSQHKPQRMFACSTKGIINYSDVHYTTNDTLLFGPETRGLPPEVLTQHPKRHIIRIPMTHTSRSLNLSNAVAIIAYEAWRQLGFTSDFELR